MEAASNLYGVTMEELGVSKILSARLQKDKKKIEASIESEQPAAV
jgi:chromosome segregation ATPase